MLDRTGLYTDFYELTMAQGYVLSGRKNERATFDYFFRRNPFGGNYTVFAGLADLLGLIRKFQFGEKDIDYLRSQGFEGKFLNYLSSFSFQGTIEAPSEGEPVFPNEPVIRVEGTLPEVQMIETLLLNCINFQSLIATKASRMRQAASQDKKLIDFGLRRAQGFGGLHVSRAAIIGGFDATSNVRAGLDYDIPVSGTMAHSWIQSFDHEIDAFHKFASYYPDNCILLVDTYDTLDIGIPNAIKIARELEQQGHRLLGIRLDSGDFESLSRKARKMLDEAGLSYVKIAVSNQMDEYTIQKLVKDKAPIDVFGVGTRLATAKDDPALDGVYKLAQIEDDPKLKLSESAEKITLPGKKKILRLFDERNKMRGDLIGLEDEKEKRTHFECVLNGDKILQRTCNNVESIRKQVYAQGEPVGSLPAVSESASYAQKRLQQLPDNLLKLEKADDPYPVYVSKKLRNLQKKHIEMLTKIEEPQ